jgi:hypothetical protein
MWVNVTRVRFMCWNKAKIYVFSSFVKILIKGTKIKS